MPRAKKAPAPTAAGMLKHRGPRHQFAVKAKITPLFHKQCAELLKLEEAADNLLDYIKLTFPRFESNWHHEIICACLEVIYGKGKSEVSVVVDGTPFTLQLPKQIKRFAAVAPPRHTKSEAISVRGPAWAIGNDPRLMFIGVTYGNSLAATNSRACKAVLQSKQSQRVFPLKFDRDGAERWKVARSDEDENGRDTMISSGILSPLTGEGGNFINVDDPFKNKSEAYSKLIRDRTYDEYQSSVRTRLQPGGAISIMHTRWHKDDLLGRLLDLARRNPKADQWIVLCLPATNDDGQSAYLEDTRTGKKQFFPKYAALWPAWFPREELDATKASSAPAFWDAMYLQNPTTAEGGIFKRDKWAEFSLSGQLYYDRIIQVWDTAQEDNDNNDYSAFVELGIADERYLVKDAYRERLTWPRLLAAVYAKWDAAVLRRQAPEILLIEQKGTGISLLQQIQANNIDPLWTGSRIPVLGMPATLSKEIRALSISGYQNSGLVALPGGVHLVKGQMIFEEEFPSATDDGGKAEFVEELADFPKGAHDDWTDAFVHGMTYFTRPVPGMDHEEVITDGEEYTINETLDDVDTRFF